PGRPPRHRGRVTNDQELHEWVDYTSSFSRRCPTPCPSPDTRSDARPRKQRIIIMGRTEIEDGPSLGDLSEYSILDDQPGPRRHLLLESAQHAEVGRVTCLLVGSGISREPFRYPHPFGETDSQIPVDVAASDQDAPGGGVKAFGRRCLARCGEPTHDHDEAGMHPTETGGAGR